MTSIKKRIEKLEESCKWTCWGDDLTPMKRRCEMLLDLAVEDEDFDASDGLFREIWYIEHGYMAEWLKAEDEARPKRWKDMNWDEKAEETTKRCRHDWYGEENGIPYTNPDHPEIPQADLDALRRRYHIAIG